MSTRATVQSLAAEARGYYYHAKEDDGAPRYRDGAAVYLAKDNRPGWIQDMAHHAHGDMRPDDWRYEFILGALSFLEEADPDDDVDALRERFYDECEADIYTSELTGWLHSRADRAGYCDDAANEYGLEGGDTMQRIALGQRAEKLEVFGLVLEFLEEHAEELNDAAELEESEADDI